MSNTKKKKKKFQDIWVPIPISSNQITDVNNNSQKNTQAGVSEWFDSIEWAKKLINKIDKKEKTQSTGSVQKESGQRHQISEKSALKPIFSNGKFKFALLQLINSEIKYRLISENANDLIFILNKYLKFEYLNEKVNQKILGYGNVELIGKNVGNIIHPDDIQSAFNYIIESWKRKEVSGELRFQTKDGTYIWLELKGKVFMGIDGQERILFIGRDVTKLKLSDLKIKKSKEKIKQKYNSIPDLYFLISKDTTILDYKGENDEFYIHPEEFLGKKIIELLPHDIGKSTLGLVEKTILTKESQKLEYNLTINNEIRYFKARFLYFSDELVAVFIQRIKQ